MMRQVVVEQYQELVDRAALASAKLGRPKEGWLRTARKALNMSGVQLANRLGVSKAAVSNVEKAELDGGVTIRKMEQMAEGLGCRFIYCIVPEKKVNDLLERQAEYKARALVARVGLQMALEDQSLSSQKLGREVERLKHEFLKELPADLWDDID